MILELARATCLNLGYLIFRGQIDLRLFTRPVIGPYGVGGYGQQSCAD